MKRMVILILIVSVLLTTMQANALAAGNEPEELYKKGVDYFEGDDFDSAFSYFQISGEVKGYAPSQNMLGVCYRDGLGIEQDLEEAERLFRLSADQGYAPAQENLDAMVAERAEKEAEKSEAYQDAMNLFFEGKYEEAKTAFEELGDYERSADFIAMCEKAMQESRGAAKTENLKVGEYITFGSYEQDNDLTNGKEPIEWLVLDVQDSRALLISRYGLDCQPYNDSLENVTWETCSLRKWLNSTFLSTAFTGEEMAKIPSVTVSADKNPSYFPSPGNSTEDQVFLLSVSEAEEYLSSRSTRKCIPTDYTKAQGVLKMTGDVNELEGKPTCWWWLRSPGFSTNRAAYVIGEFIISSGCEVDDNTIAVRPALWIDFGK